MEEPVSITNANGGFPSGPLHEGPPSKLTNRALSGSTKAMSKDIATIELIGVTTTAIAVSTRLDRDGTPGRVRAGGDGIVPDLWSRCE
jgi:hypothetical protein